jgi:hypothetical protein
MIARVLEEQEAGLSTLSPGSAPEPATLPAESPPSAIAEAMSEKCAVVTSRARRFALRMFGLCTREPRDDLFADIKPAYLKSKPVCAETRFGEPAVFDADGNEISTVKCQLVAEEGE